MCAPCLVLGESEGAVDDTTKTVYYAIGAGLFNVGWACVQVSHMALVPELTEVQSTRVVLNSARYAWTIVSNVAVFLVYLLLTDLSPGRGSEVLLSNFRILGFFCAATGATMTTLFLMGTHEDVGSHAERHALKRERTKRQREKENVAAAAADAAAFGGIDDDDREAGIRDSLLRNHAADGSTMQYGTEGSASGNGSTGGRGRAGSLGSFDESNLMPASAWFSIREFYTVGVTYMCTRLVVNVSQVYLPMYVIDTLSMPAEAEAICPLLVYVSSFAATFTIEKMYRKMGPRNAYALGAVFAIAACATFYCINHESSFGAYIGSVLLGIGNSVLMVVSVSLECDLIGENTESGAFVCMC